MHITNPLFFLLSFFIIAFIFMYFFRKQYEEMPISANFLWEQVLNEWQASPWLHKLQHNLLFWLQLLILLLLMFALIRPFWFEKGVEGENLILIVDTSATMSAAQEEDSRFMAAKADIQSLLDEVQNQGVTIIQTGQKPEILTNHEKDKKSLRKL